MIKAIVAVVVAAFWVLLVLDWRQTLRIFASPWLREINPLINWQVKYLGKPLGVHTHFTACSVIVAFFCVIFPWTTMLGVLCVGVAVEGYTVYHNWKKGLGLW